jgi:transmembrane sensor
MDRNRLIALFNLYYSGNITAGDKKELFLELDTLSEQELSELVTQAFLQFQTAPAMRGTAEANEAVDRILATGRLHPQERQRAKRIRLYARVAVAASILLFIGSWIFFRGQQTPAPVQVSQRQQPPATDAGPAGHKATLTLADGSVVVLDTTREGLLASHSNVTIRKTQDNRLVYSVKPGVQDKAGTEINTLSTPRGGHFQVELPDGSNAWLNASSSISFPVAFRKDRREVTVAGEVYFEVAKRSEPFLVNSPKGVVQVLGTHFNVMAYDNEAEAAVTLLEGSVKVSAAGGTNMLQPGQQARLNKAGGISVRSDIDTDEVVAWKNGLFAFRNTNIAVVMRELSRWYDLDIDYPNGIPDLQITGKISRSVNTSEVLSMLSYTGLHFRLSDKKITIL